MYIFIIVACVLHWVQTGTAAAQETLDPVVVSQLNEVIPDAKQGWKYYSREMNHPAACLSDKGLVIISEDSHSIQSIDEHGATHWERRNPEGLNPDFLDCSPDGRYVLLRHRFTHGGRRKGKLYETLTSDGQLLRRKTVHFDVSYRISGSGNYIVIGDNSQSYYHIYTITVVDIHTGRVLWSKNITKVTGRPVEWGSGKIAYVNRDSLSVLALDTGELKWRQSIESMFGSLDSFSSSDRRVRLVPSQDGTRLVVSMTGNLKKKRVRRVGVCDQNGRMMWQSENILGNTLGITPDSKFLVLLESLSNVPRERRSLLKLIDMSTGTVLWTLPGNFYRGHDIGSNSFIMLNDTLFMIHTRSRYQDDLPIGILILDLDSSGQIERQALIERHGIRNISLHTEAWHPRDASSPREVFLIIEGGRDWTSYFIESIGR